MNELNAEKVLRAAELIPPGHVAAYSVLARVSGTSARFVGAVLATYGAAVPWWRVTNVKGELPPHIHARALEHWRTEGIPHSERGVNMAACAVDEEALTHAWAQAITDLASTNIDNA